MSRGSTRGCEPHVAALADPTGLAVRRTPAAGAPWQEPDPTWGASGRVDLHTDIDVTGRRTDRRTDFEDAYGDWGSVAADAASDRVVGIGTTAG